jgi:hypothetical protein
MIKLRNLAAALLIVVSATALTQGAAQAQNVAERVTKDTPPTNPKDLAGVWFQAGGGKFGEYPWTPEYGAIAAKRKAASDAGNPYQPAGSSCLPRGLVGMLTTGAYPLEIFQTDKSVTVVKENGGMDRIHLNRQHLAPDDLTPLFFGDSIGHWEGNVLVVDTISLGATDNIDGQNPHSDEMRVVQKFQRTGAKSMEVEVTVIDPKAFTKPITTKTFFTARPDYELQEYYCVNDRNVTDDKGNQVVAGSK